MGIFISERVRAKLLERHNVSEKEIEEAFLNREGGFLEDSREEHKTDPATQWFVASTNHKRRLKVMFVQEGTTTHIKSAYDADPNVERIYAKYGQ